MKTLLTFLAIILSGNCVQLQSQSLLDRAKKKAEEMLTGSKKGEAEKNREAASENKLSSQEKILLRSALKDWDRFKESALRDKSDYLDFEQPEGLKVVLAETGTKQIGETTLHNYTWWIENTTGEQYNFITVRFYSDEGEVGQELTTSIVYGNEKAGRIEKSSFNAPTTIVKARIVRATSKSQHMQKMAEMNADSAVLDLSVVRFVYQDGSCSVTVNSRGIGQEYKVVLLRLDHEDGSGKFFEMIVPKGMEVSKVFPVNKKVTNVRIVGITSSNSL